MKPRTIILGLADHDLVRTLDVRHRPRTGTNLCRILDNDRLHFTIRTLLLGLLLLVGLDLSPTSNRLFAADTDPSSEDFFESSIRPILADKCFRCHGGQASQSQGAGGLRVDSRAGLLHGGESGPAIVPSEPGASRLIQAIRHEADLAPMPPDDRLSDDQIKAIERWIQAGAPWPEHSSRFASETHWSFAPLADAAIPSVRQSDWVHSSLDTFVLAKQEAAGLNPAPPASRREWLRRVTYSLTGLPPTAQQVEQLERDEDPRAKQRVIDRLLESPQYGEHWGRHWLDVVRYADTAGENSDHPLPHAWRYRNWVIQALNQDLPYDQFVRLQVAGDLFAADAPDDQFADHIIATGYLAIARRFGHDIDQDMHLTLEDTIDTLGKSILGLTLGCARCHDHKFDPLSANDYYGLYGIFASTRFAFPGCEPKQQPRDLVPLISPHDWKQRIEPLRQEIERIDRELQQLSERQTTQARDLQQQLAASTTRLAHGDIDDGGQAAIAASPDSLADGALSCSLRRGEAIQLTIGPKSNYGADTTRLELTIQSATLPSQSWSLQSIAADPQADNPQQDSEGQTRWAFIDPRNGLRLLPEYTDQLQGHAQLHAWRNGDNPSVFVNASDTPLRVWTELPPRSLHVHPAPDGSVAILWFAPADDRYLVSGQVVDGHAGGGDGVSWQLETIGNDQLLASMQTDRADRQQQLALSRRRADLEEQAIVPVAYAVTEGNPQNARLHVRGNPEDLGDEVPRKSLQLLGGQSITRPEESGRRELAQWLTSPDNPLTARVIVNRVWQKHFGRGLVQTPNDFGTRGAPPTHPELLDHLARGLMQNGWSLKWLHRQIVSSATFGQASPVGNGTPWLASPVASAEQPANRSSSEDGVTSSALPSADLYHHFMRRRLSAEELRDSLLFVTGELDLRPGGPHPFPPESTWSFTQHNPFAAEYESNQRSIYLMQKRNRRTRFFALFDGADPNASTPVRDTTLVPTQALFFLNDPFLHARADRLAQRLAKLADPAMAIDDLYRSVLMRNPSDEERRETESFLAQYQSAQVDKTSDRAARLQAWAAQVRVLLACNEFMFID